jgi:hypothetical protein
MWCGPNKRRATAGVAADGGELNAGNEFHLQLYFFCSVFLTRASCVSGVVCVLRDGLA